MKENRVVPCNVSGYTGQQFYQPALAGAQTLTEYIFDAKVYLTVGETLKRLSPDAYSLFLVDFLARGMDRYGARWKYADICTVLFSLAELFELRDYLEIGVRRGRSMAMVAAARPQASLVGFDLWQKDYAGMENPGPDFVAAELARVGFSGKLTLVSGDSHQAVPRFFADNAEAYFDMITVDGDHSEEGAAQDLQVVLPRLRIGGVVVFDDIVHPAHAYLRAVWQREVKSLANFSSYEFSDLGYGVAFAVKKSD